MKNKPDWPDAQRRLAALWHGEMLDRPCLAVRAPQAGGEAAPEVPADPEARWLDPEYVVARALHEISSTWWGGEAIPSFLLMAAWVVSLGGKPRFSHDTIWFEPRAVDFAQPSPFRYDPADPWVTKYRAALSALCAAAGRDDFLVGRPTLLPANDLLSMHLGTSAFLMALVDHPEWVRQAIVTGAQDQVRACRDLQELIRAQHDFWYGNAGWMPFWAPEPFAGTQSDVSCMLSPEMFEQFVVPELGVYGEGYGALWYHLDGSGARRHLPRLLELPWVRVVQYTPSPEELPNGPVHLGLYRAIQAAGRIVHIEVPREHVEPVVRALDPGRLLVSTWCTSREEGERLLEESRRWVT